MPYAVTYDGTRIAYESAGSGQPLLLVSGQGGDRHNWDALWPDLAAACRVVRFDHRGTGASDKPRRPDYTTRGMAADAVAVLDAAGIGRAHAFGLSMGGRIGQWLGIDHPARIGGLILGCTTPGDAHGVRREAAVDAIMVATPGSIDIRDSLELSYSPAWIEAHPELLAPVPDSSRPPAYITVQHRRASQNHDAWAGLPTITAPTLVLHGSEDRLNPTANAPLLAERIPGAELHIVAGGRHGFHEEFRPQVLDVVGGFLARHPLP
jgi:3-oxoadipate enol-lactonase